MNQPSVSDKFAVARGRVRLAAGLLVATLVLLMAGLLSGSNGWSWPAWGDARTELIVEQIRAPRTLGAWLLGALLGLSGAIAQGLFRNPLAEPYLLGSASGASLAVTLLLVVGSLGGGAVAGPWQIGLVGSAFIGALGGVLLTLALSRGARETTRLLLAGVVVGVVLSAVADLLASAAPQTLRERQVFMLGSTGLLGWSGVAWLAGGLALCLPVAWRLARVLDALTLGEDSALSLGLALPRWRMLLVVVMSLATGLAVSQAGLIAFVGLVAPHLVRRFAPAAHGYTLVASAAAGGVLLLAADVLARSVIAPQEIPVGVVTALVGGGYLLRLLARRGSS